jgi:hypothetical protein
MQETDSRIVIAKITSSRFFTGHLNNVVLAGRIIGISVFVIKESLSLQISLIYGILSRLDLNYEFKPTMVSSISTEIVKAWITRNSQLPIVFNM